MDGFADNGEVEVIDQPVVGPHERQVDLDAFAHTGRTAPPNDNLAGRLGILLNRKAVKLTPYRSAVKQTLAYFVAVGALAAIAHVRAAKTLDIYFIDVEGGQSTLLVTPAGQTLLIDACFSGIRTLPTKPPNPLDFRESPR